MNRAELLDQLLLLFSRGELAQILEVERCAIRRWIWRGQIPPALASRALRLVEYMAPLREGVPQWAVVTPRARRRLGTVRAAAWNGAHAAGRRLLRPSWQARDVAIEVVPLGMAGIE